VFKNREKYEIVKEFMYFVTHNFGKARLGENPGLNPLPRLLGHQGAIVERRAAFHEPINLITSIALQLLLRQPRAQGLSGKEIYEGVP
jgi:hypothetical protein